MQIAWTQDITQVTFFRFPVSMASVILPINQLICSGWENQVLWKLCLRKYLCLYWLSFLTWNSCGITLRAVGNENYFLIYTKRSFLISNKVSLLEREQNFCTHDYLVVPEALSSFSSWTVVEVKTVPQVIGMCNTPWLFIVETQAKA